ncbi:PREDICTED: putative E3 ubiquitin-protein ligase ARI6 isoform X1 [Erythranthe guttata]|uniref:putative E3 ubiquitin-protein ligase ARI6 isoform X1 n=1 Tax=Erythranthe guttata TaxID=4155 RepID=UPI00064DEBBA|nr:PREDICTED: putative E3 ubiquitin-protein ligase ARI6 isoform X1 [Erythranthe guttata]|eukprot:XP_012838820.1 PREDICTED: putative E3 ubiquitin-protein ligase ARI6 isoform X1 [Erythranthe guttata]
MKIVSNQSVQTMIAAAKRPFAAVNWPPAVKFPANFEAFISVCRQISTLVWLEYAVSIISFILYSASTFIAVTVPAWVFSYPTRKKKFDKPVIPAAAQFVAEINGESSDEARIDLQPLAEDDQKPVIPATAQFVAEINRESSDEEGIDLQPLAEDELSRQISHETVTPPDDELTNYDAEEIHLQETVLASILPSPSFLLEEEEPIVETSSRSFCEICLEEKASWQMFENDRCPHSFCYECTISHIISKIQDKANEIPCPAINCKAVLNSDSCRQIIPQKALVQWDEIHCMSLILDSQKLYCPFLDCSALFVNEFGGILGEIECLVCKRRFCGECMVAWHSDFTCKEFQKVYAKKGGKSDKIVKMLAKKRNWQKCPKCKMYVEKAEGCLHITCRCKYEFCYRCGSKWSESESHGNCKQKSRCCIFF